MIRDNEISRLVSYGEALGCKVIINNNYDGDGGGWAFDGSEIRVVSGVRTSKTKTILTLIHELSHHKHFIWRKNREPDLKWEEAYDRQDLFHKNLSKKPAPKKLRKKIYDFEVASAQFWEEIVFETDIKIPMWKIKLQKEYDLWAYEVFRDTGFFPKSKEWDLKWKELVLKYKNKTDFT